MRYDIKYGSKFKISPERMAEILGRYGCIYYPVSGSIVADAISRINHSQLSLTIATYNVRDNTLVLKRNCDATDTEVFNGLLAELKAEPVK